MGIAMLELKYLALLLCLSVVGALAGLAAHFWRSEVGNGTGADEDPVYEPTGFTHLSVDCRP
jgi:hypothetical protein